MRPADKAAYPAGAEVDVVATAEGGRLELDGAPLEVEQPFENVFHGKVSPAAGEHTLALVWDGGRKEVTFWVGGNAPEGFAPFREHPPLAGIECTQCHGLSRRGRFRFNGDCFTCHVEDQFMEAHPHPVHQLEQCGLCHNAHGSTVDAHLLYPKETACRLCHSL